MSRIIDAKLGGFGIGGKIGPGQGEDGQREQNDLEDEQPVLAQFLKGGAGLGFGEEPLPEHGAGDQLHDALALEQIEEDDHRDGGSEGEGEGSQGTIPLSSPNLGLSELLEEQFFEGGVRAGCKEVDAAGLAELAQRWRKFCTVCR